VFFNNREILVSLRDHSDASLRVAQGTLELALIDPKLRATRG